MTMVTQMQLAADGKVSEEMEIVAQKENFDSKKLRREIAAGRIIIPANKVHLKKGLVPIGIGKGLSTKINANIGASRVRACIDEELEKVRICMKYGADTAMDLSTGGNLDEIRSAIIGEATIPIGTVPVYQVVEEKGTIDDLTADDFLQVIEKQARQGVDYMTIHAGILLKHLPLTKGRITGVVSRGGSIMQRWMSVHKTQNPLYSVYGQILDIFADYDVTVSLGDSLRPGCVHDATDRAQIAELKTLGELTKKTWKKGVQVMVEGPGHIPMHEIRLNVDLQKKYCHGAPFYVLGPLVTDISPGYDHISSAIGAAMAGYYGADYLCYVTPKEHLGLPDADDVREGIIAYKIAAHAADIAKGIKGARERDDELSRARYAMDWERQFALSLDPERAKEYRTKDLSAGADFCSMCGPDFCSMRLDQKTRGLETYNERRVGEKRAHKYAKAENDGSFMEVDELFSKKSEKGNGKK
ncbi:MAG TPA: phosphomethylpyrimidine synthase ThiC [Candidatus Diapherotrites archaeon]|uniref:Phosphomethylpyrimidine synthase n=1 Tax=Candidatus Iainarchaeum sp. TaxID=3101447 RepID=A0A7J4IXH0_9ARCH|nr:phosphomethylpyrimidine synthase ThiC [Candidatus Diapherotrites archaeon]